MPHAHCASRREIVWPWLICGGLSPISADILTGPMPAFLAASVSFFVFFSTACFVVFRSSGETRHPIARSVLGGAAGGLLLGTLKYVFR